MIQLRFYQDADTSEEDYADKFHALCKREGHRAKMPEDWSHLEARQESARGWMGDKESFSSRCLRAVNGQWQTTRDIGDKLGSTNYRGIGSALALHMQQGRVIRRKGKFLDVTGRGHACAEWRKP